MTSRGRTVFVGNLPFDVSEEQVVQIMSAVGPVLAFRLVWDKETKRSKGYGFCEYRDAETAHSAVRNLSGQELNGRGIRVDYADNDSADAAGQGHQTRGASMDGGGGARNATMLHQGVPKPAAEAIAAVLQSMNANQLYEVMVDMKTLVQSQPDQARQLLMQHPQLSYALFQALIVMGVVNQSVITSVLQSAGAPMPQPQQQYTQQPAQQQQTMARPPSQMQQPVMYAQQVQQQQPVAPVLPPQIPDSQKAALQQIMQLTEAQIAALPMDQQQQIRQLKQQFGV